MALPLEGVTVLDLTHEIPPHDVRAGSLALARAIQYVPAGVVLAVVDPGVGTDRRAVAVQVAGGDGVLVGPDNGLLAPAVAMAGGAERAVELTHPAYHLGAPVARDAAIGEARRQGLGARFLGVHRGHQLARLQAAGALRADQAATHQRGLHQGLPRSAGAIRRSV